VTAFHFKGTSNGEVPDCNLLLELNTAPR